MGDAIGCSKGQSFDLKKLEGSYYEIALHDYTQYPICPKPRCVRSHNWYWTHSEIWSTTPFILCASGVIINSRSILLLRAQLDFFLELSALFHTLYFPLDLQKVAGLV